MQVITNFRVATDAQAIVLTRRLNAVADSISGDDLFIRDTTIAQSLVYQLCRLRDSVEVIKEEEGD